MYFNLKSLLLLVCLSCLGVVASLEEDSIDNRGLPSVLVTKSRNGTHKKSFHLLTSSSAQSSHTKSHNSPSDKPPSSLGLMETTNCTKKHPYSSRFVKTKNSTKTSPRRGARRRMARRYLKRPQTRESIRTYRKKSRKRNRKRRVKNKSLRCNRLNEVSCPLKCISANKICDGVPDCSDGRDEKHCKELEIGLKGGKKRGEGRVWMKMNNVKGSLCGKSWSDEDASVYCRMLGYRLGGEAKTSRKQGFGMGLGLVWSISFNCKGDEKDLFLCPLNKSTTLCTHLHDAAVVCRVETQKAATAKPATAKPATTGGLQCGVKKINQPVLKILGGRTALYGTQPWQARLVEKSSSRHLCGASIVNDQWIVTAAHCFKTLTHKNAAVVVGDHNLVARDSWEQVFSISELFLHPMFNLSSHHNDDYYFDDVFNNPFMIFWAFKGRSHWNSRKTAASFKFDIALLKLTAYKKGKGLPDKISFNDHVQPLCLPDEHTAYPHGLKCEISGWGNSGKHQKGSTKLKVAKLSLIQSNVCERVYGPMFFNKLPPQMVCAASLSDHSDTCQGDSGGPLTCKVNGVHTLMGVTSWGFECGESRAPGVYTKVGVLRKWIDRTIQQN